MVTGGVKPLFLLTIYAPSRVEILPSLLSVCLYTCVCAQNTEHA